MAFVPPPKKRKADSGWGIPSFPKSGDVGSSSTAVIPLAGGAEVRILQAKIAAARQAQQEGCLGNYKSFDSPCGNYLVPVIPSSADLL